MSDFERNRPTESTHDNFGVDFNCGINTIITKLTEKPCGTIFHLTSNWKAISDTEDFFAFEHGDTYDLFCAIEMHLVSELKIKSAPETKDRNARIIKASIQFNNAQHAPWVRKVAKIVEESSRLGIALSFVDSEPRHIEGTPKDDFVKVSWLIPQSPEIKWAIKLDKDYTVWNSIFLKYPHDGALDLEGSLTIQDILQNMSAAVEHALRVCYAVEGKVLPEKRLVFFPYVEPKKTKGESFAPCPYCRSVYSTSEAECPTCGARASRPS